MKILVTGGAGFIGSHVAQAYVDDGHEVTVLDNLSSGKEDSIPQGARFVRMDVTCEKTEDFVAEGSFDLINHHAAQIDVRKSVEDPYYDASVNTVGGVRLLAGARRAGTGLFIFASSGGVLYGECAQKPPDENTILMPCSPYGLSKRSFEDCLRLWHSSYGLNAVICRYGNVYGPRQDPCGEAGVIAIFAGRMLKNEPVTIYGSGEQVRDFIFVGDVVSANVRATGYLAGHKDGRICEVFNIGTGKSASVNEVFTLMKRLTGYARKAEYGPARPGELEKSCLNSGKAHAVLSWTTRTGLERGLDETIAYFRKTIRM